MAPHRPPVWCGGWRPEAEQPLPPEEVGGARPAGCSLEHKEVSTPPGQGRPRPVQNPVAKTEVARDKAEDRAPRAPFTLHYRVPYKPTKSSMLRLGSDDEKIGAGVWGMDRGREE